MLRSRLRQWVRQNDMVYRKLRIGKMWLIRKQYGFHSVDSTCLICEPSLVSRDLVAGRFAFVNQGCRVCPGVAIGRYTMLGPDVLIAGGDHNAKVAGVPAIFAGREPFRQTTIGDDVWIGARAVIRSGVTIGDGAIVGMGAVVVKDVAAYDVVAGNPARVIGRRFSDDEAEKHRAMLASGVEEVRFAHDIARDISEPPHPS